MLFHISPLLCLHDLDPSSGWHSKVGKTDFWGVKNIDIWTGSKFVTQIWEAVFYCDWWSLFRKSILLTFEPAQKSTGSDVANSHTWEWLQRCIPKTNECSEMLHSKTNTNRPVDWLRYWLSALLLYHSKTDEYNIQKTNSNAGFRCDIATAWSLSEAGECWEMSRFWPYVLRTGEKMIRTAVRAAALAKMLGFVKVLSYIGPWRTVLTGSMVTRMVTHYGKLLYELQRYVVYQARPIC